MCFLHVHPGGSGFADLCISGQLCRRQHIPINWKDALLRKMFPVPLHYVISSTNFSMRKMKPVFKMVVLKCSNRTEATWKISLAGAATISDRTVLQEQRIANTIQDNASEISTGLFLGLESLIFMGMPVMALDWKDFNSYVSCLQKCAASAPRPINTLCFPQPLRNSSHWLAMECICEPSSQQWLSR